jgi:hypothetical protein
MVLPILNKITATQEKEKKPKKKEKEKPKAPVKRSTRKSTSDKLSPQEKYARKRSMYEDASNLRKIFRKYFLAVFTPNPPVTPSTQDIKDLFVDNHALLVRRSFLSF